MSDVSGNLAIAQREATMLNEGIDRFAKRQDRLAETGAASERQDYSRLIEQHLLNVSERIRSEIEEQSRNALLVKLKDLNPELISLIALSSTYSALASTNLEMEISADIGYRLNDEVRYGHIKAQNSKLLKRLTEIAQKNHGAYRQQRSFVLNAAAKDGLITEEWSKDEQAKLGKIMVVLLTECGIIEVTTVTRKKGKRIFKNNEVSLTQASLDYLEAHRKQAAAGLLPMVTPVYTPMLGKPREWSGPVGGGYHTLNSPLVRGAKATQWDMPKVYKAVNLAQSTPWRLNRQMVELVGYMWKNGIVAGKLPSGEIIPKPAKLPPEEWEALDEEAQKGIKLERREIHEHNRQAGSDKVSMGMLLDQANELLDEPAIYMPYFIDYRGRAYCVPMLNPQQSGYIRCMLEFANGKPIGADGGKWLGIHVATEWDGPEKLSKQPFEVRVDWAFDNAEFLHRVAADPIGTIDEWKVADKPFMFVRAAIEWSAYRKSQCNPGFVSHMPISLDGTCSGIQHYSAMLRDEETGRKVNLIEGDRAADVYQDVADAVIRRVEADIDGEWRTFWLNHGITRKMCKKPTMTYGYSSREEGFTNWYRDEYAKKAQLRGSEAQHAARYLAKHTLAAVEEMLPSVAQCMEWLQHCVSLLAHEGKGISWVTPSGFPVVQKEEEIPSKVVKATLGGKRVAVSIPDKAKGVDKAAQKRGIGPNFVHSMDAAHLALTVLNANERYGITEFALIHDSFGTLAADADDLFYGVRDAFVEMYQNNDPLTDLWMRVYDALSPSEREKLREPPKQGTLDITQVAQSLYAFA